MITVACSLIILIYVGCWVQIFKQASNANNAAIYFASYITYMYVYTNRCTPRVEMITSSTHDRDFFQASAIIVYRFVIDGLIKSGGCLIQKKRQVGCSVQNLKQPNINASNAAPFSVLLLHNYVHTYSYCYSSYDNINTSFTHIVVRHFSSPSARGCLFSRVQAKVGYVV